MLNLSDNVKITTGLHSGETGQVTMVFPEGILQPNVVYMIHYHDSQNCGMYADDELELIEERK